MLDGRMMMPRLDVTLCALGAVLLLSVLVSQRSSPSLPGSIASGTSSFGGVLVTAIVVESDAPDDVPRVIIEVRGRDWEGNNNDGWGIAGRGFAATAWLDVQSWTGEAGIRNTSLEYWVRCTVTTCIDGVRNQTSVEIEPNATVAIPAEES